MSLPAAALVVWKVAATVVLVLFLVNPCTTAEQPRPDSLLHVLVAPGGRRQLQQSEGLPLDLIKLPPGFAIELYSPDSFPARFMALGQADDNVTIVYVSSTETTVTALVDRRDGSPARACTLLDNLANPNGIVYERSTGTLWVAETRQITRHSGVDAAALAGCNGTLLTSSLVAGPDILPAQASHGNRALAIGPSDGKLYVTVAAPFNVAVCTDPYCSIHRLDQNGSNWEVFARGIRNAAGFEWNPVTGDLMFAGMERDLMGNDRPDDVLVATNPATPGVDYGWPYCHWVGYGQPEERQAGPGTTIPDTDVFPPGLNNQSQTALAQRCNSTPPPVQALGPHVAPLGLLYWAASNDSNAERWPSAYDDSVFLAEHGSWNRDQKIGHRVSNVKLSADGRTAVNHTVFAEGWLGANNTDWGRPVALLRLPDGSMLLSDDSNGVVYRITYRGVQAQAGGAQSPVGGAESPVGGAVVPSAPAPSGGSP